MIALIYDSETTGLDPDIDRIVQHGALAYEIKSGKVLDARTWLCWEKSFPAVASGEKVHGWSLPTLMLHAHHPSWGIQGLLDLWAKWNCRFFIAHNGIHFDRNMLAAELKRNSGRAVLNPTTPLIEAPWIDTLAHADYPGCPSKSLLTIAAHNGFLNPFPHDALSNCYTLVTILNRNPALIGQMINRAATTLSLIFANIPPGFNAANNRMVKAKGFKWQDLDGHHVDGCWIRLVDRDKVPSFTTECLSAGFQVNVIRDIPPAPGYETLHAEVKGML